MKGIVRLKSISKPYGEFSTHSGAVSFVLIVDGDGVECGIAVTLHYDVLTATIYNISLSVCCLNCERAACLHASGIYDTSDCESYLQIRVCRFDEVKSNFISLDRLNLLSTDLNFV